MLVAVVVGQLAGCGRSKEAKVASKAEGKQPAQAAQQKKEPMSAKAQSALAGLKKLDFRTTVGISYRDYSAAVTEAVFPASEYLKTPEGRKDLPFNEVVRNSSRYYLLAAEVWNPSSECVSPAILVRLKEEFTIADAGCISQKSIIRLLWSHASGELKKVEDL
jgi:hypothetical protein